MALSLNIFLLLSAPISWSLVLKPFSLLYNVSASYSWFLLLKPLFELVNASILPLLSLRLVSLPINIHTSWQFRDGTLIGF